MGKALSTVFIRPALLCTAALMCANMVCAEEKAMSDRPRRISTPVQTAERVKQTQTVRLALLHGVPEKWNLHANFEVFLRMLDKAAAENADMLITPECWLDGYAAADKTSTPERLKQVAQDLGDSPYLARVADEAKRHSLHLCFGFTSLENGRIYNAAGLWNAGGQLIGVYHKAHLQTHDLQFAPGDALPVWPTVWGPIGIMICADRRWPETARTLRLQGARLILNPTYGFKGDLNEAMMRTRAYENQCFIAFAHPEVSLITGPDGKVVAKEETGEPGVLMCDLDLENARDDNHLRDRRPELYGPITERKSGTGNPNSAGSTLPESDATQGYHTERR